MSDVALEPAVPTGDALGSKPPSSSNPWGGRSLAAKLSPILSTIEFSTKATLAEERLKLELWRGCGILAMKFSSERVGW